MIIKWEEFPVLIDLIGLIDFNRLSIDLKLVIHNLSQFPALLFTFALSLQEVDDYHQEYIIEREGEYRTSV